MPHLYGDLTRAVISSLATPLFWYKALVQQQLSDLKVSQVIICMSMTLIAKYSWQSYLFRDLNACYAGFAATNVLTIVTCLYKFPNPESRTLLGHFFMYLVFAGANTSLSFVVKLCMASEASLVVIVLAYVSPHYTLKKVVPIVVASSVGFSLFQIGLLVAFSTGNKLNLFRPALRTVPGRRPFSDDDSGAGIHRWKSMLRSHSATLLILAVFIYVLAFEIWAIVMQEEYANNNHGLHNLISASFFGIVGLVTAGALREKVDTKQAKARAAALHAQHHETLVLATMALNASHTAIAVADEARRIKLCNPAFSAILGHAVDTSLVDCVLEDLLGLTLPGDIERLQHSFVDPLVFGENEYLCLGRAIQVQVSPSATAAADAESTLVDVAHGFVVVLRDVTDERTLELAIESAQQQAALTQAILNAIDSLTNRFVPQQAIQFPIPQPQQLMPPPLAPQFAVGGGMLNVIDNDDEDDVQAADMQRFMNNDFDEDDPVDW